MLFARCARSAVLAASALALCGCGAGGGDLPRKAVSGVVSLDGKPIESALITFMPVSLDETPTPAATQATAGVFSLPPESGLVAGEYKVSISAVKEIRRKRSGAATAPSDEFDTTPTRETIPPRYNVQTQLTADVTDSGPNEFNFLVTSR